MNGDSNDKPARAEDERSIRIAVVGLAAAVILVVLVIAASVLSHTG